MLTLMYVGVSFVFLGILAAAYAPRLFKQAKVVGYTVQKTLENAIDNPVQENRYDIAKAEQQLQTYKGNLARLIAANKKLEHDMESAEHEKVKYANLAVAAAQKGNKEDVTEAISKKNLHGSRYEAFKMEIDKNNVLIGAVNDNIRKEVDRIETAKTKTTQLEARLTNVEIRSTMVNTELGEGLNNLDKFEASVEQQENLLEGKIQVFSNTTLEDKYAENSNSKEVDELLSQYSKSN